MTRVLVAEDSTATRQYLVELLGADPALEVVGEARDGEEAVALAEALRPDVVVMDVEMPRMDGYQATRRIMERVPTPIVMVSAHARHLEQRAFEALRAGALTLLNKPAGPGHREYPATTRQLVSTVRLMAEVKVIRRWAPREAPPPSGVVGRVTPPRTIRVVAIAASAGGPPTLAEILSGLPGDLPCPVLVVQHIAPGFGGGLAEWLGRATPLTVKLAAADEPARPGTVYVAPDGAHMGIGQDRQIRLERERHVDGFRPSATHLLRSVARSQGSAAIGIVLTGMGRDGAAGLLDLRRAGGVTVAQDRESSVVFGMPAEAIRIGAAEHVMPASRIAETIRSLVEREPRR